MRSLSRKSAAGKLRPRQASTLKTNALQECAGDIHTDERNAVGVQLLQSFDTPAIAAFSLGGVDDLPRLVVLLLEAVAGFAEIEDHGDKHAETAEIFEHFQERPIAEGEGDPFTEPLEGPQRHSPAAFQSLPTNVPGFRAFSVKAHSHRVSLPLGPRFYSSEGEHETKIERCEPGCAYAGPADKLSGVNDGDLKEILRAGGGQGGRDCGG